MNYNQTSMSEVISTRYYIDTDVDITDRVISGRTTIIKDEIEAAELARSMHRYSQVVFVHEKSSNGAGGTKTKKTRVFGIPK